MQHRQPLPLPTVTAALPDLVISRTDARHVAQVFSALIGETSIAAGSVVKVICRPTRWAPDFSQAFAEFTDALPQVTFEVVADPAIRDEVVDRLQRAVISWKRDELFVRRAPLGFAS